MELTIEFIKRKFEKFNKEFFNNELPPIAFKIGHGRKFQGTYRFRRNFDGTETPLLISITNYYNRTNKQYCEILIHEMIHYYLSYKNIGRKEDPHGYSFKKIMNKINENTDYNITIFADLTNLKSKNELRGKEYTMVLFEYNGKKYLSRVSTKLQNKTYVENKFNIEVIKYVKTKSPEVEKLRNRTSILSLIPATKENLIKFKIAA